MPTDLPAWAQSKLAAELLSIIIREQPDAQTSYRLSGLYGGHREPCAPHYHGKAPAQLRRLYREWLEREYAIRDSRFAVTGIWDGDGLDVESADELITRILSAPAQARAA